MRQEVINSTVGLRRQPLDPYGYLKDGLERQPTQRASEIDALLTHPLVAYKLILLRLAPQPVNMTWLAAYGA